MQSSSRPSNPHEVLRLADQPAIIPASVEAEAVVAQLRNKSDTRQAPAPPSPPSAAKTAQPVRRSALAYAPTAILAIVVIAIAALSIWYLVRPEPLLLQGE